MKTDSHLIYMRDYVNGLKWFKKRSFFIKKGDIIWRALKKSFHRIIV